MTFSQTAAVATVILTAASPVTAADIRFAPSNAIILNAAYPPRGYTDLVAQTVAIHAGRRDGFTVESIRFDLLKRGMVVASRNITASEALASTSNFAQLPVEGLRAAQLLNRNGLTGWFGPRVRLAHSATLASNEALILTGTYFALNIAPDQLRVTVIGRGNSRIVQAEIPVTEYHSPVKYRLPLKGAWFETALPMLQSHHRFIPPNEFAVDLFKVNADGEAVHDSTSDATHWYGYGQAVFAAADGEVVRAAGDRVQDRSFLVQRPGETVEQRAERVGRTLQARALSDVPASLEGNVVVLRHQVGNVVEYSSYGHLKTGSLRVKVGDHVKVGEQIAEVGDTGDTTVVHLHFQVNAGPDPFFSQSLPFTFSGIDHMGSSQDPGWPISSE